MRDAIGQALASYMSGRRDGPGTKLKSTEKMPDQLDWKGNELLGSCMIHMQHPTTRDLIHADERKK